MSTLSVQGKKILVTGAGRGIGKHLSNRLFSLGAVVIGVDQKFDDKDYQFQIQYTADLTSHESYEAFLEELQARFVSIDVLINNAGITLPSEVRPYPIINWKKTFQVNIDVPFRLTSSVIPLLRSSDSPSVINISSLNAAMAFPNNPAYVATKTALLGLTRSMALDYGNNNIRFNAIAPGYIKTDMTGDSWTDPIQRQRRQDRTALGRWGTPEDLVGAVIFLASDSSSYITGQTLFIDGGWSIKGL